VLHTNGAVAEAATIRAVQALGDWLAGFHPLWGVVILTFVPALELRAAIPFGLLIPNAPPWWLVTLTAVGTNWLVAPLVYLFMRYAVDGLRRWRWFERHWERYTERVQRRIHRQVETWGAWGLALFIAVPLPGSGVYTGALGAYLLGMGLRRFMWVALVGVILAGAAVTLIVLSGSEAWSWLVNTRAVAG